MSSIEFNLRMFIKHVDNGSQPTDDLMKFMADGAREFLRGGKPWQKGDGGAPEKFNRDCQAAFLLRKVGGMSVKQIPDVLGIASADGKDKSRTIYRDIDRGKKDLGINLTLHPFPPFGANESQWLNLKAVLKDLLDGSVADLRRHPKVLDKLNSLWAKIEAAEADLSREPNL